MSRRYNLCLTYDDIKLLLKVAEEIMIEYPENIGFSIPITEGIYDLKHDSLPMKIKNNYFKEFFSNED